MNARAALLEPDRDQIEIFFDAVFRHAAPGGIVSLSAFYDDKTQHYKTFKEKLNGAGLKNVFEVAEDLARRCANELRPTVLAPPPATFERADGEGSASEAAVKEGLALVIDLDGGWPPAQALAMMEALLGPATLVVESGGVWTAPDGPGYAKLHAYWRLTKPATADARTRLKEARELATALVGGDPSGVPICHGFRCPGSYHRKDVKNPKLCVVTELRPDREIDLAVALEALKKVVPIGKASSGHQQQGNAAGGQQQSFDWGAAYASILQNIAYHPALLGLADAKIKAGLSVGATINDLRAVMNQCPQPRKNTWQERYDKIPEYVNDAVKFINPQAKPAPQPPPPPPGPLVYFNAGRDLTKPPPREWLLGTVFCRKFLSSLVGPGAVGKSALRFAQLISLAIGRSLTGEHVFHRCRVGIVSLEDDIDEVRRRIEAICIHHNVNREDLDGWLFYTAPKGLKLAGMQGNSPAIGHLDKLLRDWITQLKLDIVSLDPFVKTHSIEENHNSGMDFVCELIASLAIELNIAADTPHHAKKGVTAPGDADSGRGASAIKDAARLVYTLAAMNGEEAERLGISEDERRAYIRLDSAKVNLAPPAGKATWFKLVGVRLDNGNGGYPAGDEVQTVAAWKPPETWADTSDATLNLILNDIQAGLPNGQRYSDAGAAKNRAAWWVVRNHYPGKPEAQCRDIINTWVKSGLLLSEDYDDPVTFKSSKGIQVDDGKRPGAKTCN
jgi:hypothetical protein